MTNPVKTAIPPNVGVTLLCDVLPLGLEQRFFSIVILTIDGIVINVMTNAIKNPEIINSHKGKDRILPGNINYDMLNCKYYN